MNLLHRIKEIVGIERHADIIANLFRHAEVGRIITTQPVGIHHVWIVGTHHQLGQVVIKRLVVVFCP